MVSALWPFSDEVKQKKLETFDINVYVKSVLDSLYANENSIFCLK